MCFASNDVNWTSVKSVVTAIRFTIDDKHLIKLYVFENNT